MELRGNQIVERFVYCDVEGIRFVIIPPDHLADAWKICETARKFSELLHRHLYSIQPHDGEIYYYFEGIENGFRLEDLPENLFDGAGAIFLWAEEASLSC